MIEQSGRDDLPLFVKLPQANKIISTENTVVAGYYWLLRLKFDSLDIAAASITVFLKEKIKLLTTCNIAYV